MAELVTPELSPSQFGSFVRSNLGLSQICRAEGSLLVLSVITSHLKELGYPQKSINSMLKCGAPTGYFVNKKCGCGMKALPLTHHCSLRVCPDCSKIRKRRIFRKFLPFFKQFRVTKQDFFQFLTISPVNYGSLQGGFKDIRKNFSKFLRRKYIKERVKAGFYILETKQSNNGTWNIHIHAVIYGRWLDYRLRGHCNKCHQNLLKYNKRKNLFYCANRRCNSFDVIRYQDTRLNREWADSSGKTAHIYGERVKSTYGAIHYLTKYISADKSAFLSSEALADYIFSTRKQRLINAFGLFYNSKITIQYPFVCHQCGEEINFFIDLEVSMCLMKPPPTQESPRLLPVPV